MPKERHWTTANWDGYTGVWEIKNNQLYLQKVIIEISENHSTEKREVKGIDSFLVNIKQTMESLLPGLAEKYG